MFSKNYTWDRYLYTDIGNWQIMEIRGKSHLVSRRQVESSIEETGFEQKQLSSRPSAPPIPVEAADFPVRGWERSSQMWTAVAVMKPLVSLTYLWALVCVFVSMWHFTLHFRCYLTAGLIFTLFQPLKQPRPQPLQRIHNLL